MEKNYKIIIVLLVIIILFIGVSYIFTPSIEIENLHGEKTTYITKYTYSGKTEKIVNLDILFDVVSSNANDKGIKYLCLGYDKNDKLIFNESGECGGLTGEQGFSFSDGDYGIKDVAKVKKIELYIYEYGEVGSSTSDHGVMLYHGFTEDIQKCDDNVEKIDDTPEPTPTKHRELTEREIIEMDAEAYGQAEVGDYYLGHDEDGNLKRYKKHDPIYH